ncbi:hypothetical protein L6654_17165 [Bradyrhizobium sp. WYCCWR 13023]|uniref:Uncharacterized protein n=1 Tax=Bradyrhizobium zhengyangense TaxID=2911009 RepID=A0A9X1U7V9_9BRAD|nr:MULTISPECIES: hypothetical protein [Bradyrhizobium]MCG2628365.1 hypothetical protein [Bradyrhizobium zhengyangense]MCG2640239.1 hypothetical protein [Bradyrhizobium zhengyangense]MCG2665521.1 hypothetical protein [Bradyrhizobium zhengyangense]
MPPVNIRADIVQPFTGRTDNARLVRALSFSAAENSISAIPLAAEKRYLSAP